MLCLHAVYSLNMSKQVNENIHSDNLNNNKVKENKWFVVHGSVEKCKYIYRKDLKFVKILENSLSIEEY